jgi:hypothetical protein
MLYVERLFKSLQPLYDQPWFPYALGCIGLLFAYSIFKTLNSLPKLVMYPIIGATCVIVCINWVYNRNEPELISPIVDAIAPFLPSKM